MSLVQLKELLLRAFPNESLVPQESTGNGFAISLPNSVLEIYKHVGPNNFTVPAFGNSFFIPSLDELDDFQWGYSIIGRTKEINPDWPHNWVVIASQGADPFICDLETGQILFAQHGSGSWEADDAFESAEKMLWAMAITGEIFKNAGSNIKKQHIAEAINKLEMHGFINGAATLELFGWL